MSVVISFDISVENLSNQTIVVKFKSTSNWNTKRTESHRRALAVSRAQSRQLNLRQLNKNAVDKALFKKNIKLHTIIYARTLCRVFFFF